MLVNYPTSLQEMEINLKVITSVKIAVIFSLFLLTANGPSGSEVVVVINIHIPFRVFCCVDYLPSV